MAERVRVESRGAVMFAAALLVVAGAIIAATPLTLGLWDEIYYMAWVDGPRRYDALVHPFGLPLHSIYAALGESFIALRLLGVALLAGTGAVMGRELARYYQVVAPDASLNHLTLVGALASLLYYVLWVLTPSYNLLANAGGALVVAGAFGWAARDRGAEGRDWPASLWCGLGGALAFLGKPTFAILAGMTVGIHLLVVLRRSPAVAARRVAIAGAAAVFLVGLSILSVMPINMFLARVDAGVAVLSSDYSAVSLVRQTILSAWNAPRYLFLTAGALVVSWSIAIVARAATASRWRTLLIAVLAAVVLMDGMVLARLAVRGLIDGVDPWTISVGTPVVSLMLATLALGVLLRPAVARSPVRMLPMLLLVAIPYLISFGTANDLLKQAGMSLFPVLVAGVLCARLCFSPRLALLVELGWIAVAMLLLGWSAARPYNQPAPVFASTEAVASPFGASTLHVDPATAAYARDLSRLRRAANITADTPVLDLSGVAPGTVALLGARAPFFPWMIHFSKNPGALAAAAWLSMSQEDRQRAWIVGPIHRRFAEHPDILRIARSGRYRRVATLRYAPGSRSWPVAPEPGHPPVSFWAPVGH